MVKKALLIGINYKNTPNELKGCIRDIENIKNILVKYCEYSIDNIKILTDESSILPTKKNIEDNINWLISNNIKGDTLFYYYSGHGSYMKDTSKDESNKKDELIIPLDYDTQGGIVDDWFFENMVSKIPENINLWCFSDSCYSGTVMDLKYNYNSKNKLINKKEEVINYAPENWSDKYSFSVEKSKDVAGNVFLFSGCLDNETSEDAFVANENQGAFTYCLLETIKNSFIKKYDTVERFDPGNIKLRNVLKEINCRLIINKFDQKCQLSMSKQQNIENLFNI